VPVLGVAVGSYIAFTLINMWGVRLSAGFELLMTVVAVIELVVFGIVVLPHFSWEKFSIDPLPQGTWGVFAALPFAMWFYLAIEGIANVAEEARAPQRDLPRGFLWSMATLVALTAITLFGAVGVDGWRSVVYTADGAESDSPLPLAIRHVVSPGSPLFLALTSIGLVGLLASFHGILIIGGRAMLELGRVRYLPAALGVVHPRRHTPIAALGANMVVGLLALFTGRTADVIYLSVFGALTLYVLSSAAVIALRVREPGLLRSYRTPGYPITPAIALALSAICLAAMVWSHWKLALLFAGILAGGWVMFVIFVPKSERATFRGDAPPAAP
jgi:ethanolamine permease